MSIAFLTNHFPPAVDGVGDYTFFLAAELARQGHAVHVVCREQPEIMAPENVTVHTVVAYWQVDSDALVPDLLWKIRPDWLLLQYVPYGFHPLGLPFFLPRILRRLRQANVHTGVMFHEVHIRTRGLKGWIIGNLQRYIARQLCHHADTVVTSNEFYKQMLSGLHRDIRVIPVGANMVVEPLSDTARVQLREKYLPKASFVVATFGNRNISELKQAVGRLREAGVGLLVCGATPPLAPPPKERGGGEVAHTGYLSPVELSSCLQCADLFVLPDPVTPDGEGGTSLKSGSLAAAFAAGLPVVGVRGDMSREPLRHGENIWLTENGDAENLREAIWKLYADVVLREKLRANGAALYEEHLRWEIIARQFLNTMQKLGEG